jgi:hypothetical protein
VAELSPTKQEGEKVHQILVGAGLIRPSSPVEKVESISEAERIDIARSLAEAGPLSNLILSERDNR